MLTKLLQSKASKSNALLVTRRLFYPRTVLHYSRLQNLLKNTQNMQAAVIEHSFRLQQEFIKSDKFGQMYHFSDKGDKKPEDNDASKVPPGFEKFFKRKTPTE
jgi:hypothetical protein